MAAAAPARGARGALELDGLVLDLGPVVRRSTTISVPPTMAPPMSSGAQPGSAVSGAQGQRQGGEPRGNRRRSCGILFSHQLQVERVAEAVQHQQLQFQHAAGGSCGTVISTSVSASARARRRRWHR
jgi:hypothetical protein